MAVKGAADAADTAVTQSAFAGTAGTDFVATSGSLTVSSVSALAGPWYVERQTLDIFYYRVPHQFSVPAPEVSLVGTTYTSGAPVYTYISYYAIATCEASIVNQTFNSSSVQQAQEFTINAVSADSNGVNYGNINASTMGPMGDIITTTPFIRRTPYIGGSSQPLYSKTATGSNFAAALEPVSGSTSTCNTIIDIKDATPYLGDQEWFKDFGCVPGTARYGHPYNITAGTPNPRHYRFNNAYSINGAYDTTKESVAQIQAFIDSVGLNMSNEQHFAWPVANATASQDRPERDTGIAEYDINRHA